MNILTEALPETVDIDGAAVPVTTDFRACLRIILAFEDEELTPQEKIGIMLTLLYPVLPDNLPAALERARWFLNGGEEGRDSDAPRLYSFAKDAPLIFAAFRQTHHIDLDDANMHWWKFLALFMDLGADTVFCNLVSLRKRVKDGTATRDEKRVAAEMGEAFEIPDTDTRTLAEREAEAEFLRMVEQAERQ